MTEFPALWPKTFSYLMDDSNSNRKAKGTKKCVIKRRLKFQFCLIKHKMNLLLKILLPLLIKS